MGRSPKLFHPTKAGSARWFLGGQKSFEQRISEEESARARQIFLTRSNCRHCGTSCALFGWAANMEHAMTNKDTKHILSLMTKHWNQSPEFEHQDDWARHAAWLADAIAQGRPRTELDEYMSRAQLELGLAESAAFRQIVDEATETLPTTPAR
jgi:hypothetical protein